MLTESENEPRKAPCPLKAIAYRVRQAVVRDVGLGQQWRRHDRDAACAALPLGQQQPERPFSFTGKCQVLDLKRSSWENTHSIECFCNVQRV